MFVLTNNRVNKNRHQESCTLLTLSTEGYIYWVMLWLEIYGGKLHCLTDGRPNECRVVGICQASPGYPLGTVEWATMQCDTFLKHVKLIRKNMSGLLQRSEWAVLSHQRWHTYLKISNNVFFSEIKEPDTLSDFLYNVMPSDLLHMNVLLTWKSEIN